MKNNNEYIYIDGNSLTLEQFEEITVYNKKIKLSETAKKQIIKCREFIDEIIAKDEVVYGLTTGFGKFSTIRIPQHEIAELQENLIISHATGVGPSFSIPEIRGIMLLRINVLAKGHSGIRLSTLETLIEMLNKEVHPVIPEKGSVGASGDLAPLSHLALVLLGMGEAFYQGERLDGSKAMEKAGIIPVKLAAKEGLALNNGTQVMTAVGAMALLRAEHLTRLADITAAATIDALLATPNAFDKLIHELRPHEGQLKSSANISKLLQNSPLRDSHIDCENVQDAYSLRCTSQVHGAVRDSLAFVRKSITIEFNSATDNPLIFPDERKVISGGNFHGEPIAFACDILGFTVSELANISERRMEQMFNPSLNRNLKPFLAPKPGLHSGFMIAQLTAASLVSENKVLAHPASVDSIPTSANQEDHVSMGTIGAVKARNIVNNTTYVLAIELMAAAQALDEREIKSSASIEKIKKIVRNIVPHFDSDVVMYPLLENMKTLVESDEVKNLLTEELTLE
ncbi:MAG: histidine ammonia-lyase [Candidatus Cloacimonetes bacterium]|nr:histidine ammonia-lyase [Candidatus Cloacimonadota bacterium]